MTIETKKLQTFRKGLYRLFPYRRDAIMDLLDALTSFGQECRSVVQLSEADCFDRHYSNITRAISEGLSAVEGHAVLKLVYETFHSSKPNVINHFVLDCTPQPRPYARKLADRSIVHASNPAPGNKPICVGHSYSLIGLLPDDPEATRKNWIIPLSTDLVESSEKGHEHGMKTLVEMIKGLGLENRINMSIGDALYGTEVCRRIASEQENLIHLFRLNGRRNIYCSPSEKPSPTAKGRKKEFGERMQLQKPSTYPPHDKEQEVPWITRRGKKHRVILKAWRNMLLPGSREFHACEHPVTLIQINAITEEGQSVFRQPLWIVVSGKKRDSIDILEAYRLYVSRYDIEHFFRFGKQKLLMDAYQTPNAEYEESWWRFCLLAYLQLYLSKSSVENIQRPWEKYLKPRKDRKFERGEVLTPSQTQRGFHRLLDEIGTPARSCVARGRPCGRIAGTSVESRTEKPVIFKKTFAERNLRKTILSTAEKNRDFAQPETIDELLNWVRKKLNQLDYSPPDFIKKLLELD